MTPEPLSGASISSHAAEEAARRQIPEGRIREALESPGQVLPVRTGRVVVHLRYHEGTREYLLRAFVDIDRESPVVVTVYRTSKNRQVLEFAMKVTYDAETDTLRVVLRDALIAESDEDKPGVILDYDADGKIVSFELLDASRQVEDPRQVEFVEVA